METHSVHSQVLAEIAAARDQVLPWWGCEAGLLHWLPPSGGWSVQEILDHITLTSHYLLKLIDKGARKSLKAKANGEILQLDPEYSLIPKSLDAAGDLSAFYWHRPEHMDPRIHPVAYESRGQFLEQMQECESLLNLLEGGWGHWCKTTMSVNNLGKLDVYQYIVFLCRHAERHCRQMERNQQQYPEALGI